MEKRKVRNWVAGGLAGFALIAVAIVVVAWIMGGTQPTTWIEIPVQVAGVAQ